MARAIATRCFWPSGEFAGDSNRLVRLNPTPFGSKGPGFLRGSSAGQPLHLERSLHHVLQARVMWGERAEKS